MINLPEIGTCDECDRLAIEFEQAKQDALQAAADAQGYAEDSETAKQDAITAKQGAEDARDDSEELHQTMLGILGQAQAILEQVRIAATGRLSQVFTTTANQSTFVFSPSGYTYSEGDYFEVYVNGLKLTSLEYTYERNVVTLTTPIMLADQTVEILAYISAEDEPE